MTHNQLKLAMPSNSKFGGLFSMILFVIFVYFYLKDEVNYAVISLFFSSLFIVVTLVKSSILTPLNRAWFQLSLAMGKVVSPIVLSTIFFIMFVPVALSMRFLGRDALLLKKRQVSSYWVDKEPAEINSFKNQF